MIYRSVALTGQLRSAIAPARVAGMALAVVLPMCAGGCWIEIEEDEADLRSSVESMLTESAAAWNRGDLDGFMADYLESDATTYIGGSGLLAGYEAIRGRYAPLFATGAERDSLRFEGIRVRRLGAVDGLISARWILHRNGTITSSGPFTLIVRHTSGGWRVIHHHSSSDPPDTVD